jgi:hypothetical protein
MNKRKVDIYLSYWIFDEFDPTNLSDKLIQMIDRTRLAYYFASLYHDNVYMVTDSKTKHLFEDIPFTNIFVELDDLNEMDPRYSRYWSISKIKTVEFAAKKERPFIHIDNDVFLMTELPDFLFEADVFCQNPEPTNDPAFVSYNIDTFYKMYDYLGYAEKRVVNAYNTGLLGFMNVDFAKKFAKSALEFTFHKDNMRILEIDHEKQNYNNKFLKIDESSKNISGLQAVLWNEQYYIGCAIEQERVKVVCHFNSHNQLENLRLKNEKGWGYSHLMSGKEDPRIIIIMSQLSNKIVSCNYAPGCI